MFFEAIINALSAMAVWVLHACSKGSFPRALTAAEEQQLLEQMYNGDEKAKAKLIEHNLRLVAHITKKYYSGVADNDDLISIGTIGLIKAISTFREDRGIKLATYAARCIENEILMYFRSVRKSAGDLSFSDPIDTDKEGNALTLMDVVADESNFTEEVELRINSQKLGAYINKYLSPREKRIIDLRYGMTSGQELAQREVAKKLGISRSYVSRIEKKALEKLRAAYEE